MKLRTGRMLVAIVFFVGTLGFSTTAFAKKFMIGLKGGANMATFVGSDADFPNTDKKRIVRPTGGAVAAINIASFGIQPEVLYATRGVKYTSTQGDGALIERLNYLQIPVLFRFNLSLPGIPITPKLMLGPSTSFYLSGEAETEGQFDRTFEVKKKDIRSPQYSAIAGAGVDVGLGPGALLVGLRYEQGLGHVLSDEAEKDAQETTYFNSVIAGHVGYAIGF